MLARIAVESARIPDNSECVLPSAYDCVCRPLRPLVLWLTKPWPGTMSSIVQGSYYPETSEGRAEWWENIQDHGEPLLATLGLPPERIASILADAAWGLYSYGTLRASADRYADDVARFATAVATGVALGPDHELPCPPRPPRFLSPPDAGIAGDFEGRRLEWVAEVKASPAYTQELGEALGLEQIPTAFSGGNYRCELNELVCSGPKTVTGKFRKAHGNIEGIVLRGRRLGSASWTELGRFNATPFSAAVPMSSPEPEVWEFQARALKRGIEMGVASPMAEAIVQP